MRGPGALRHQLQGLLVFAGTWALSAGALALLHRVAGDGSTWLNTLVVAIATLTATAIKFVAMRHWMFRSQQAGGGGVIEQRRDPLAEAVLIPDSAGS